MRVTVVRHEGYGLTVVEEDGVQVLAYADDLAMIISADTADLLALRINETLRRLDRWIGRKGLELAPNKTECLVMRGRASDIERITHQGATITPALRTRYLGVIMEYRGQFGAHIRHCTEKAMAKVTALTRMMRNTFSIPTEKRRLLCAVVDNVLLYAAPIWGDTVNKQKYKKMLIQVQRKNLSRMACSFRTVSAKALQVITSSPPIYYEVRKRKAMFEQQIANTEANRTTMQRRIIEEWQAEWDGERTVAQWTKRLIPQVQPWHDCGHKNLGYHLTQALTGHGHFGSYTLRIGKTAEDICMYCNDSDDPEHTLFSCHKWDHVRSAAHAQLGYILTPENFLQTVTDSKDKWKAVETMFVNIMKGKEEGVRSLRAPNQ